MKHTILRNINHFGLRFLATIPAPQIDKLSLRDGIKHIAIEPDCYKLFSSYDNVVVQRSLAPKSYNAVALLLRGEIDLATYFVVCKFNDKEKKVQ
jgi:hypothetical protein